MNKIINYPVPVTVSLLFVGDIDYTIVGVVSIESEDGNIQLTKTDGNIAVIPKGYLVLDVTELEAD